MKKYLDVRKIPLTDKTFTMGTLFRMEGLIMAYENYRDITGFLPEEIVMTQEQYDAYNRQINDMASILGLAIKEGDIVFRGTKIKIV